MTRAFSSKNLLLCLSLPAVLLACSSGKLEGKDDTGDIGGDGATDDGTGDDGKDSGATNTDTDTDTDGDTDADTDTDGGGGDCDAMVLSVEPDDGDTDVNLGSTIRFTLSDADSTAVVTLASLDGSSVSGSSWLSDEDTVAVFQPSTALAAGATYVATLDYCGGSETAQFTTLDPGTPVSGLVGKGYLVDLGSATWVEPAGVGDLISGLGDFEMLLGVAAETDSTITMFGATGNGSGGQDTCAPTIDFPPADFSSNPYFQLGPTDMAFDAGGYAIEISNFRLGASFNETATRIEDGTVEGELDMRVLGPLVGDLLGTTDPATICSYLTFLGVTCSSCSGDGASYCIGVEIQDVVANEIGGGLDEIDQENCHEDCDASASNPDCTL
ncbi:MAG: Ig-like domain-containing protein [Alphaproteobacteria bacterium]|nr:Ig-like domain-containing protein [Alphaproteobacteria bacterium]